MAFASLVDRFRTTLCATIYAILKDWHLTQDVAQETFAAAFRALPLLSEAGRFRGWLFRIGRNRAISSLRRATAVRLRSLSCIEEEEVLGHLRDGGCVLTDGRNLGGPGRATRERIRRVVLALPNEYGSLLTMRYVEGLSVEELAIATDRTPSGVKSALYRARVLARDVLTRSGLDFERVLNEM